ncbi:MAG: tetratricopeptide repeat protein, partial [Bryobacteraceae bacterium]
HYDNSDANPRNPNRPPKRVVGGNRATDEMGHLWLQVLPRGAGDQRMILQEAIMRHRLEKYPADFAAHFNLGALMLRRDDPTAAIAYLTDALRVEPDQPVALNTLGAALESTGKRDEAVAQFRHALRVQPDYANARYNLANILADKGKLDEAAANFREILEASPGDKGAKDHLIEVLTELGNSSGSQGHLEAATGYYRELVALQPINANLRNNYGTLLARSGNLAAAIDQFKEALKIDPFNATARRNLDLAAKVQVR